MVLATGAAVVLAARRGDQLHEIAQDIAARGGRALGVPTDMTDASDCKRLIDQAVEHFGKVDGLVTVAAMPEDNLLITECPDDLTNWRPIMDTNFFGTLQVVKQTLKQ